MKAKDRNQDRDEQPSLPCTGMVRAADIQEWHLGWDLQNEQKVARREAWGMASKRAAFAKTQGRVDFNELQKWKEAQCDSAA